MAVASEVKAYRRLLTAVSVRNFAYGLLSVALGLIWKSRDISPWQIGLLFTFALLAGGLFSALAGQYADRVGRRTLLLFLSILMAAGGLGLAVFRSFVPLLVVAAFATFSPSGKDIGAMLPIEQACLARITRSDSRTEAYARYNLLASLAGAAGALAAAAAPWVSRILPGTPGIGDVVFSAYGLLGLALFAIYAGLGDAIERVEADVTLRARRGGLGKSRGVVYRLTALFGVDALAGGLVVQGLVSIWLYARFGVGLTVLGPLFFLTNLAAALSLLAAPPLTRRFGLLNTMVFTHLPSNLFLLLVAFAPTFPLAAAFLVARGLLSQLDVPTRQAYTMELVRPEERAPAAGVTASVRGLASAVSPTLASAAAGLGFGVPFAAAGALKVAYDLTLYAMFRTVPLSGDSGPS